MLFYSWLSTMNWTPGPDSSNLIKTEKAVPTKPDNKAKIRYKIPMSLALDEKNHLSVQRGKSFKNSPVFMLFVILLSSLYPILRCDTS